MCDHGERTIIEGQHVCTLCGLELGQRVFITGYNRSYHYKPVQVYSRQKRFNHFILGLKSPLVFEFLDEILTVFGILEFHFNMGKKFERKYFFNRFVTLAFILQHLGIPLKTKTLKDELRVQQQMREMGILLENNSFCK